MFTSELRALVTADTRGFDSALSSSQKKMSSFARTVGTNTDVTFAGDSAPLVKASDNATKAVTGFKTKADQSTDVTFNGDYGPLRAATAGASRSVTQFRDRAGRYSTVNFDGDTSSLTAATSAANRNMANFQSNAARNSTVTFKADTSQYTAGMQDAEQATTGFLGVGSSLKMFLGTLAGGAVLGAAASSIFNFNSQMQQSEIAFTTMLDSGEKAKAFLEDLAQFAQRTPFEFPDLVNASRMMLAFGFNAEEVRPLLESVGNTASAMGLSGSEGIGRMVYALGQMKAATVVQLGEINQLTEMGIPAYDILAEAMGMSVAAAKELASQGKVSSDVFINAFQEFAKVNYGDMMAKQALTFQGAMSTIKDTSVQFGAAAIRPFFLLAAAIVRVVATLMTSSGLGAAIGAVWEQFTGFTADLYGTVQAIDLVAKGADNAGMALNLLPPGFQSIARSAGMSLRPIQGFTANLLDAARYMGVVARSSDFMNDHITHVPEAWRPGLHTIGAFIATIKDASKNSDEFGRRSAYMSERQFEVAIAIRRVTNRLGEYGNAVKEALGQQFSEAIKRMGEFGKVAREGAARGLNAAGRALGNFAIKMADAVTSEKPLENVISQLPEVIQPTAQAFTDLARAVGKWVTAIKDLATPIAQGFFSELQKGFNQAFAPLKKSLFSFLDQTFGTDARHHIIDSIMSWKDGITSQIKNLAENLGQQATMIAKAMNDPKTAEMLRQLGADWGKALIDSLGNMINAVEKFLGIASPSTKFIVIGKAIIAGMITGMFSARGLLIAAAVAAAAAVVAAVTGFFQKNKPETTSIVVGAPQGEGAAPPTPEEQQKIRTQVEGMDVSPEAEAAILAQMGVIGQKGGQEAGGAFSQAWGDSVGQQGLTLPAIGDFFGNLWDSIKTGVGGVLSAIGTALAPIGEQVMFALTPIIEAWSMVWPQLKLAFADFLTGLQAMGPAVKPLAALIGGFLRGALEAIVPIIAIALVGALRAAGLLFKLFGQAVGWVGTQLQPFIPIIQTVGRIIGWLAGPAVIGAIGKALGFLGKILSGTGMGLKGLSPMFDSLGRVINAAFLAKLGPVRQFGVAIGDFITNIVGKMPIAGGIIQRVGQALQAVGFAISSTANTARVLWAIFGGVVKIFGVVIKAVFNFVKAYKVFSAEGSRGMAIWKAFGNFFRTLWTGVKSVVMSFVNWFKATFPETSKVVAKVAKAIGKWMSGIWTKITAPIGKAKKIIMGFWNWFKQTAAGKAIIQAVSSLWKTLWGDFKRGLQVLVQAVKAGFNAIRGNFTQAKNILGKTWKALWNALKATAQLFWKAFKGLVSGAWKVITGLFKNNDAKVIQGMKQMWAALQRMWQVAKTGLLQIATILWKSMRALWTNGWNAVKNFMLAAWKSFDQATGGAFTRIATTVKNILTGLWDTAKSIGNSIKDALITAFNTAKDAVGPIFEKLKEAALGPLEALWNGLKTTMNFILEGIAKVLDAVNLGSLAQKVRGAKFTEGGGGGSSGGGGGGTRQLAKGGVFGPGEEVIVGDKGQREYVINPKRKDNAGLLTAAAGDMGYQVRKTRSKRSGRGEGLGATHYNVDADIKNRADQIAHETGTTWNTYVGHGEPGGSTENRTVDFWGGGRGTPLSPSQGFATAEKALKYQPPPVLYVIRQGEYWRDGAWQPWPQDPHYDHTHVSWVSGDKALSGGAGGIIESLWASAGEAIWNRLVQPRVDSFSAKAKKGMILRQAAGAAFEMAMNGIKEKIIGAAGETTTGATGKSPGGLTIAEAVAQGGWTANLQKTAAGVVWGESGGNAGVTNSIGARGLFQIIPSTAQAFRLDYQKLLDPIYNAMGGYKVYQGQGWGAWDAYPPSAEDMSHANSPVTNYAKGGQPKPHYVTDDTMVNYGEALKSGEREYFLTESSKYRKRNTDLWMQFGARTGILGMAKGGATQNTALTEKDVGIFKQRAEAAMGHPYMYGSTGTHAGPDGYSCSGLWNWILTGSHAETGRGTYAYAAGQMGLVKGPGQIEIGVMTSGAGGPDGTHMAGDLAGISYESTTTGGVHHGRMAGSFPSVWHLGAAEDDAADSPAAQDPEAGGKSSPSPRGRALGGGGGGGGGGGSRSTMSGGGGGSAGGGRATGGSGGGSAGGGLAVGGSGATAGHGRAQGGNGGGTATTGGASEKGQMRLEKELRKMNKLLQELPEGILEAGLRNLKGGFRTHDAQKRGEASRAGRTALSGPNLRG